MRLADKTAIITGGATGIGQAIAVAFATEGCRVAITGRTEKRLREAAAGFDGRPPMIVQTCDVADRADIKRLFAWLDRQLGPLDILVNNAGINIRQPTLEQSEEDFRKIIDTNLVGAFLWIDGCLFEDLRPVGDCGEFPF